MLRKGSYRLFNIGALSLVLLVHKPTHAMDDASYAILLGLAGSVAGGVGLCVGHVLCLKCRDMSDRVMGYVPYYDEGWEVQKSKVGASYKICRWKKEFSITNTKAFVLGRTLYPHEGGGHLIPLVSAWWEERGLELPERFLGGSYRFLARTMEISSGKSYRIDKAVLVFSPTEKASYDVDLFFKGGIHAYSKGMTNQHRNLYMEFDMQKSVAKDLPSHVCCGQLWDSNPVYTAALQKLSSVEVVKNDEGVIRLFFSLAVLPHATFINNTDMRFGSVIQTIMADSAKRYWEIRR